MSASFPARFAAAAERAELPVDLGPLEGWAPLATLATDRFEIAEAYIGEWQAFYPGLDRRGGAAFLVGGIAYTVTGAMLATRITDGVIPDLDAMGVVLDGRELKYRLPDELRFEPCDPIEMARRLEALLAPLIDRLRAETGLGLPAFWRCAADSFASAHLHTGRALDTEARSRLEALSVLSQPGLRMANRQTGYRDVSIACADGRAVTQGFLKRGGCCRYYTADNAEYCATCVLRPEGQQIERLEAYLHEVHEPAIAAE